ncbi:MAG: DUF4157 domain-containing protein [bacterium]
MKEPEGEKAPAPAPAPQVAPQVAPVQQQSASVSPSFQSVELSGAGAVDDTPSRSQQSSELMQFEGGQGQRVQAAAARGIAGGGQAMPHQEAIQRSFGEHDISGIQAHVGGAAEAANAEMGATAYATGNDVAFKGQPDLHTAAHEAAHVVQQRQGVSLAEGVGQVGDSYEQHADAVADMVVQGESAEALLSAGSGGSAGGSQTRGVQQKTDLDGPVQFDDPPAAAGPSLVEQIRTALDDGEEESAITLMGRCNPTQANTVLRLYMDLATSCFGNVTMGSACRALVRAGGDLGKALLWSIDEGTDYGILTSIIRAADPTARRALGTKAWRDRFVSELGNDEMASIVDLLGLSLADKIRWMDEEGTSWEALHGKIVAAPPTERAVLRDNAWLPYFTRMCGNDEMAILVDLLGGDLVWKLKWMNEEGTDWGAMRIRIEAAPDTERLAVYDQADLQAMFVSECNDEEMIAAVGLLGGPLSKRIEWCSAEGASTWEQILGVIQATPEPDRLSIYDSSHVTTLFAGFKEEEVIEAIRLCGGTPTQKLTLWGTRPIALMLPLITPADDWAAGLLATGHADDLLRLAAGADGPAWKTAIDNQNLIDSVISNASPTAEEDTYRGLYTLFGDATTRTRPQMDAIFPKLFAQTQLRKAGEITNVAYGTGITHTDAAGRTYQVAKRPIPVDPSDAGFAAFFNIMQRVSRMAASATNTLQFAAQEEFYWWENSPVASTEYHRWSTPVLRDIPTSYAGAGW